MNKGIQLIRVAIAGGDIDNFHLLLCDLENLENIRDLIEKYGKIMWTTGQSMVNDNCVEVFISLSAYIMLRLYNRELSIMKKD